MIPKSSDILLQKLQTDARFHLIPIVQVCSKKLRLAFKRLPPYRRLSARHRPQEAEPAEGSLPPSSAQYAMASMEVKMVETEAPGPSRWRRKRLELLVHARECVRRHISMITDRAFTRPRNCGVGRCTEARMLLRHQLHCKDHVFCEYPRCVSSQALLNHWDSCDAFECFDCDAVAERVLLLRAGARRM